MTREERDKALWEEFTAAHRNIITVMENHIMPMTGCDRKTANLVANEVLELDREIDSLLETPTEKIKKEISWDRLSEIATQALHGLLEDDRESAMEYFRDTIDLTDEEREYFGVPTETEEYTFTCEDCPYHYYDEGEEYPSCHHTDEHDVAPCEYEPEEKSYEYDDYYEEESWDYEDRNYNRLYDDEENDYTPSATNGDYSPSNPWDAPGMSIRDFI